MTRSPTVPLPVASCTMIGPLLPSRHATKAGSPDSPEPMGSLLERMTQPRNSLGFKILITISLQSRGRFLGSHFLGLQFLGRLPMRSFPFARDRHDLGDFLAHMLDARGVGELPR